MKTLLTLLAAMLLAGCPAAQIQIKSIDPVTGIIDDCIVKTMRRVAITCGNATVISGQVLINDKTVQVLAKAAALPDNQE